MDMEALVLDPLFMDWLLALGLATAINLLVLLATRVGSRTLRRWSSRTSTLADDTLATALEATRQWLVLPISLFLGAQFLELSPAASHALRVAATLSAFAQLALWSGAALEVYFVGLRARASQADIGATTGLAAIAFIARLAIWSIALLLALTNIGVDVTAFVAGLGVGGIAVALAVQNILGDLFASLSIVLDKPFVAGDFIVVDEYMGTVEQVGLKTTRIRSLSGEQLVFANGDLLKARMRNFKRMRERRVVLGFGVLYRTGVDHLEAIPTMVSDIVKAIPGTRFDRAHLMRFGDSSLDFELVYWVLDPDYNRHMDIQQTVMLKLIRTFQEHEIDFAFPTRTMVMEGTTRLKLSMNRAELESGSSSMAASH